VNWLVGVIAAICILDGLYVAVVLGRRLGAGPVGGTQIQAVRGGAAGRGRGVAGGCVVSTLPEIVDAVIIRNPQPEDVVVLRVPAYVTQEQCEQLLDAARAAMPCKVILVSGDIEVATVAEVTL
jgi:hypothetical protein